MLKASCARKLRYNGMRDLRASGFQSKSDDHVDGSSSEEGYTLHDCDLREESDVFGFFELDLRRSMPLLQVQGSLSRAGCRVKSESQSHRIGGLGVSHSSHSAERSSEDADWYEDDDHTGSLALHPVGLGTIMLMPDLMLCESTTRCTIRFNAIRWTNTT